MVSIYVPRLNLHTGRYHVKYIWTKRDTYVKGVAQLMLVILEQVNMAWTIYALTCEHCMICQFGDYLYLCTYTGLPAHTIKIFFRNLFLTEIFLRKRLNFRKTVYFKEILGIF